MKGPRLFKKHVAFRVYYRKRDGHVKTTADSVALPNPKILAIRTALTDGKKPGQKKDRKRIGNFHRFQMPKPHPDGSGRGPASRPGLHARRMPVSGLPAGVTSGQPPYTTSGALDDQTGATDQPPRCFSSV